ncbi:forespore capture DNA-binding protein RefZ [Mesobacillus subterraneus]|uniref:forespore capture DNA-binding protein RefZ n=1 Tax=Mesobacillus subterraneus TaxID=285983 RepID=UPI00204226C0|nr:forespore capture DNA-binding protein RefZ [Mesobacillus subterraneus]MCM3666032.1 forespore capture DNA-binding protein RefZ [Mesobacillus subterraneus]MCM3684915.1 forespore capture DNA-binding protein RefZ [Mesobacillus subterraneus]
MRKNSKAAIIDAAIFLFNTKGFNGTSIRDIAAKADVNAANISYYFQNKNGLLENCFTVFFESYLEELEKGFSLLECGAEICMKAMVDNVLRYQCENTQLTRFILREMTIDSQVVREIMSTYHVKERYLFKKVLEYGMETGEFKKLSVPFSILQLKGLLSMPFLNTHYVTEVLHILPHERYFAEKYSSEISQWIKGTLCIDQHQEKMLIII